MLEGNCRGSDVKAICCETALKLFDEPVVAAAATFFAKAIRSSSFVAPLN